MFDGTPYRDEFNLRIQTIERILDVADPSAAPTLKLNVSREARGLAILLLFASYENLMTSLCRGLLEKAISLRVGNRRLKSGFKQFAVHHIFKSISESSESKIWRESGRKIIDCIFESKSCSVDSNLFPIDGSFMKRSQVKLFCEIFELGDPGPILMEIWSRLDTIVVERNNIAHGQMTPEQIGRAYSHADIRKLVTDWKVRWIDFINHVEKTASSRDFYRSRGRA